MNQDVLLERIHKEFPDIVWGHYKYLNNGWDHEVIILDNKLVFRFPNSPEYLKVLEDEVNLLGFISQKAKINIPKYEYIAKDYSFAGYQLIKGSELKESVFVTLSDNDRNKIAEQLAEFFTFFHTLDVGEMSEKYHVAYEKPLEERLKSLGEEYLRPNLSASEYQKVEHVIKEVEQLNYANVPFVLTHSDFSPKHIIWNSVDRSVGIIDFSDRCITDPAIDFAELYLYSSEFVEQIYDLYKGPKDSEFLIRAKIHLRRAGVHMMAHSFKNQKISFEQAKQIFDKAVLL